jgi:HAD superfamily hydrolase (TIGR01509 family)
VSLPGAVVFDNDGLTLDTETVWSRAEVKLFEEHGAVFTHEHKLELVGNAAPLAGRKIAAMLGLPEARSGELMERLHVLLLAELALGCEPMPGARELRAALAADGVPVALCSNSPRVIVDAALRGANLEGAFAATVAGDDGHAPKPAPDPYLAAAAALGVAPQGCVALEDSPTGATSARAAGMRVIGVPSVPGVSLDGVCDEQHESLEAHALWASLGLAPGQAGAGSAVTDPG